MSAQGIHTSTRERASLRSGERQGHDRQANYTWRSTETGLYLTGKKYTAVVCCCAVRIEAKRCGTKVPKNFVYRLSKKSIKLVRTNSRQQLMNFIHPSHTGSTSYTKPSNKPRIRYINSSRWSGLPTHLLTIDGKMLLMLKDSAQKPISIQQVPSSFRYPQA